jgi:hypothetical protein
VLSYIASTYCAHGHVPEPGQVLVVLTASTHIVVSAGHLTSFRVLSRSERICAVKRLFRGATPKGSSPLSSTEFLQFRGTFQSCVGNDVTVHVTSWVVASIHATAMLAGSFPTPVTGWPSQSWATPAAAPPTAWMASPASTSTALSSSAAALPTLLAFAKPGHITFGSDWPFAPSRPASCSPPAGDLRRARRADPQRHRTHQCPGAFPRLGTAQPPPSSSRVDNAKHIASRAVIRGITKLISAT